MKKIILICVICVKIFVIGVSNLCFSQNIHFETGSWEQILTKAKEENKLIFFYVYLSWCKPCKWMEKNAFTQVAAAEYYNEHFICAKTDIDMEKDEDTFLSIIIDYYIDYKITGYPALLFINSNGEVVYLSVGAKTGNDLIETGRMALMLKTVVENIEDDGTLLPNTSYRFTGNDGRYTLGVRGQRLMYGYPYPYSTSHFVVKVDAQFASNYYGLGSGKVFYDRYYQYPKGFWAKLLSIFIKPKPKLKYKRCRAKKCQIEYLNDTLEMTFGDSSVTTNIRYNYEGLDIRQHLMPVDDNLSEVSLDEFGKYYSIKYEIINKSGSAKKVGLLQLFDTMIDDNDACKIDIFATPDIIELKKSNKNRGVEQKLTGEEVPARLLIYHDEKLLTDALTGDIHTSLGDATKPDEMFIGSWPYLHSVVWNISSSRTKVKRGYRDSAILMKWNQVKINDGDTLNFIVY